MGEHSAFIASQRLMLVQVYRLSSPTRVFNINEARPLRLVTLAERFQRRRGLHRGDVAGITR